MLPNKARGVPRVDDRVSWMAFSGCCGPVLRGAISRAPLVPTPRVTTALCAGDAPGLEPDHWGARRCPWWRHPNDRHVHRARAPARRMCLPEQEAVHGTVTRRADQQDSCGCRQ